MPRAKKTLGIGGANIIMDSRFDVVRAVYSGTWRRVFGGVVPRLFEASSFLVWLLSCPGNLNYRNYMSGDIKMDVEDLGYVMKTPKSDRNKNKQLALFTPHDGKHRIGAVPWKYGISRLIWHNERERENLWLIFLFLKVKVKLYSHRYFIYLRLNRLRQCSP